MKICDKDEILLITQGQGNPSSKVAPAGGVTLCYVNRALI